MKNLNKKIIFDTDVLSHFAHAGQLKTLFDFYKGRICIPFDVKDEILEMDNKKNNRFAPETAKCGRTLMNYIVKYGVIVIDIQTGTPEYETYIELKEVYHMDRGESACIAIAKHNDKIISSCNYSDIGKFIDNDEVINIPVLEILLALYKEGIKTLEEIEAIKAKMESKNAKLPEGSIKAWFNL